MGEKKLVPKRRFQEFEEEWIEGSLGDFGTVEMNKRIFKWQTSTRGDVPFYKIGTFGKKPDAFISYDVFNEYKLKYPYPNRGDILISASGSIGRTIEYDDEDAYFQDSNIVWLKHDGRINNLFLKQFYKIVKWNGLEGSTIQRLYNKDILETNITTPQTYKEQQKIGEFFRILDERIANQERKIAKVKALKSAYLTEMFPQEGETVPRRRFKGFNGEWEAVKLEDIADIIGGGTPSTRNEEYWNGKIDWYSPTEIGTEVYASKSAKTLTELGLQKSSATILPANKTLLFTSRAGIGDMAILTKEAATNQGFQSLVLKNKIDIYFIYSMGYKIKKYALINASGSTFLEVSGKTLGKMDVILPSFEEQQKIGQFFKNLDDQIATEEKKLTKLKKMKEAYLEEMFV